MKNGRSFISQNVTFVKGDFSLNGQLEGNRDSFPMTTLHSKIGAPLVVLLSYVVPSDPTVLIIWIQLLVMIVQVH